MSNQDTRSTDRSRDAGQSRDPHRQNAAPNTVQIVAWRGLLDAFGQLSAAWEAAGQAQRAAEPGAGPGALQMPDKLVSSFALVCRDSAEVLTGIANVLAHQKADPEEFARVLESQRAARDAWEKAQEALKADQGTS